MYSPRNGAADPPAQEPLCVLLQLLLPWRAARCRHAWCSIPRLPDPPEAQASAAAAAAADVPILLDALVIALAQGASAVPSDVQIVVVPPVAAAAAAAAAFPPADQQQLIVAAVAAVAAAPSDALLSSILSKAHPAVKRWRRRWWKFTKKAAPDVTHS